VLGDLLVRFALGGAIVSAFAAVGEVFEPKTFSGLFGAAPSVAIASLSLAFARQGPSYAAVEARSMIAGAVALFAYSGASVLTTRRRSLPVWLGAVAALLAWVAVAAALWALGALAGVLS
jgi:hypothetical protein